MLYPHQKKDTKESFTAGFVEVVVNPRASVLNSSNPMRLPYEAPKLTDHGDVRDVTLGGSSGIGDSSNPGTEQP